MKVHHQEMIKLISEFEAVIPSKHVPAALEVALLFAHRALDGVVAAACAALPEPDQEMMAAASAARVRANTPLEYRDPPVEEIDETAEAEGERADIPQGGEPSADPVAEPCTARLDPEEGVAAPSSGSDAERRTALQRRVDQVNADATASATRLSRPTTVAAPRPREPELVPDHLHEREAELIKKGTVWSDEEFQSLVSMRSAGTSWADIADRLGRGTATCQFMFYKNSKVKLLREAAKAN